VASEFGLTRWWSEKEEITGAIDWCHLPWRLSGDHRIQMTRDITTWLRAWGVAQSWWTTQIPGTAVRPRRRWSGRGTAWPQCPGPIRGVIFSLSSSIHRPEARIVAIGNNHGRGSPTVRFTESVDFFATVPSEVSSVGLTGLIWGEFSLDFMWWLDQCSASKL
jgi:hypothetical protein